MTPLQLDYQEINRLLQNKLNFKIVSILLLYQELSLTQISDKCNASKSTILRHLPSLFQTNLIELSKTKLRRGDRPAKYFRLSKFFIDMLFQSESQSDRVDPQILKIRLAIISKLINQISLGTNSFIPQQSDINLSLDMHNLSLSCIIKMPITEPIESIKTIDNLDNEKEANVSVSPILKEFRKLGIEIEGHIQMDKEKIRGIDLSGLNLKVVPEFIKDLQDLEHLNLENNLIEDLPLFLDEMPALKSIDVSKNPLSLPPERIEFLNRKYLFYW